MKTIRLFCSVLMVIFTMTACNDDPSEYTLVRPADNMHIRASVEEIVLNKSMAQNEAVTFAWDEAISPIPTYDSITYMFRLYATDTKSDNQTDYYLLGNNREITFSHKDLNSIVSRWSDPGNPIKVTAQVIGTVYNEIKYVLPEISTVDMTVTSYEETPTYLYLHLLSQTGGNERIVRLSQRKRGTGVYEATCDVSPGEYFFTTTATDSFPAYGKGEGDDGIQYITEGTVPRFSIDVTGKRTFIVDINSDYMDCRVKNIVSLPNPETLRLCGNGCSVGWDPASSEGLFTIDNPREPYIYTWTGDFIADGELKINTGTSWNDQFFFAPENHANPATDHRLPMYRYQSQGGDIKWQVATSGKFTFKLCLDADDMWTSFEPAK